MKKYLLGLLSVLSVVSFAESYFGVKNVEEAKKPTTLAIKPYVSVGANYTNFIKHGFTAGLNPKLGLEVSYLAKEYEKFNLYYVGGLGTQASIYFLNQVAAEGDTTIDFGIKALYKWSDNLGFYASFKAEAGLLYGFNITYVNLAAKEASRIGVLGTGVLGLGMDYKNFNIGLDIRGGYAYINESSSKPIFATGLK